MGAILQIFNLLQTAGLTNQGNVNLGNNALSSLVGDYKNVFFPIAAMGFVFGGVAVVRALKSDPKKGFKAIGGYTFSLFVFILLWALL